MQNKEPTENLLKEFDRQVENLVHLGYPKIAGISEEEFTSRVRPLKEKVAPLDMPVINLEQGHLPFVIVIKEKFIPVEKMMTLVERESKKGIVNLYPIEPDSFQPNEEITVRGGIAYLLVDIDRGIETINIPPQDALPLIKAKGRSPLTIEEGIAIVTHYPEFLIKNNCYSLLASRCGDARVPAIWISEGSPKLGWCWNGNPHTWLGSASCKNRIGN